MKGMGKLWRIVYLTLLISLPSLAQQSDETGNAADASSPLSSLGDEYENSIKLLQNRFRVDHNVKEVTMIFFREYGSAPVVLVRPDGSKMFQGRFDEEKVAWYDADTFDMITIKDPVPGPWQAVGQVLPNSRVMVISDIELNAQPLPPILFSGEILKSTAYLTNGGKPIENSLFRDVVELSIDFLSTNNPNFDNFATNDQEIARFEDNGRGMDERPADGVFTGQFNLNIAPGEWKPKFTVKTPMFTREHIDPPIVLHPNPVFITVETDGGGEGYHKLIIDVNRALVDIQSLLIDGKVRYPNTDVQNFSLTEGGDEVREHLIVAYEEGIFRIKLTAYGTTTDGRDFILDVPEYSFLADAPEPEIIDPLIDGEDPIVDGSEEIPLIGTSFESDEEVPTAPVEDNMDSSTLIILLAAVNGSILFIGVLAAVFIVFRRRKAKQRPTLSAKQAASDKKPVTEEGLSLEAEPKGLKKWLGIFSKKKS